MFSYPDDIWHYPRLDLAERLLKSINSGIIHSFVIFAPRRIGKTEFLLLDLKPLAINNNYHVIYFNFHSHIQGKSTSDLFLKELKNTVSSRNKVFEKIEITGIDLPWCKINLKEQAIDSLDVNQLICLLVAKLEKQGKKLLLLLDEIQELVFKEQDKWLIGSLRTTLDINKLNVKVIFTGSSRAGLRTMFNDAHAPFFHFGANIEFESFGKSFIDFLANQYSVITNRSIDTDELYNIFLKLNRITLYIREVVNLVILNPKWTLNDAFKYYMHELSDSENFLDKWQNLSRAEKCVLIALADDIQGLYSDEFQEFLQQRQVKITRGQLQYAIKKLSNQLDIIINLENKYEINDILLKNWILDNVIIGYTLIGLGNKHKKVELYNVKKHSIYESKPIKLDQLTKQFNELRSNDSNEFIAETNKNGEIIFIDPSGELYDFFIELKNELQ